MKIHIVQKDDTMWSIARKYGVSFDALREINGHIREPELAVPGMKLKIPSTAKAVSKEPVHRSETSADSNTGQQAPAPTFHNSPAIQEDDMSAAPYPFVPQMPQITAPEQGANVYPTPQQQNYVDVPPQQPVNMTQDQHMQGYPFYQQENGPWPMQGQQHMQEDWNVVQPGQQGLYGNWNTQGQGQPGQPGQQPMQGDWNMQGMQPGQQP
ncbi:morphogenetic protein associated with SpoVID, partial [Terribacillus aidingensis]